MRFKDIVKNIVISDLEELTFEDKVWLVSRGYYINTPGYNVFGYKVNKETGCDTFVLNNRRGDTTEWDGMTDWGDGTIDNSLTHTYEEDGEYFIVTKYWFKEINTNKSTHDDIHILSINNNFIDYYG